MARCASLDVGVTRRALPVDVQAATEAPAASTESFQCVDSVVQPESSFLSLRQPLVGPPLSPYSLSFVAPHPWPVSFHPLGHFSVVVVAISRASAGCAREGAFAS